MKKYSNILNNFSINNIYINIVLKKFLYVDIVIKSANKKNKNAIL
jgi:hypothetical protein